MSRLASGSLDFDFMVVVAATAIVENHLLVLVVRVGVSVRVRLRSVVRWQDAGVSAIISDYREAVALCNQSQISEAYGWEAPPTSMYKVNVDRVASGDG
ncbi:hypothetical protein SO802_023325 [Lithocarpus litseifolius]|uniref:Uncharacterized protein n=1 Tax=Lithocarpus litseifolius TaxID=425828 RepID=A0AAW2C7V8_9ROSI